MSVQTIEHDGTWWAQGPDGTWRRWSHVFGDWEPSEGPQLGPAVASGPEGQHQVLSFSPVAGIPALDAAPPTWVLDYLGTLLRLLLPGLLVGLAIPVAFLLSLAFLFLFDGGVLPPPDNVKAILIWSSVAGGSVAAVMVGARHLPRHRRFGDAARRAVAGAVAGAGLVVAWLATGPRWSGSTASKAVTLAVVLLLGVGIDAMHRRGAFAWLRTMRTARRSPFTGPG